jgi:hypothetical protein
MDLQNLPLEALESELKRRRNAQLGELKSRLREHQKAVADLELELETLAGPRPVTRRRKARP